MSNFVIFFRFFTWLKYPIFFTLIVIFVFYMDITFYLLLFRKKGLKQVKGSYVKIKHSSFLRKLFLEFPKQYALDLVNTPKDFFKYQGLIIYEGRQGSGKTCTMVRDTLEIKKQYPKCKYITNLSMTGQDMSLNHWKQLINYKNGIYGVVVCMDELQNWFSSNQSKTFPPEMLSVITQNRKNRRVIFGTAQSFHLLAKSIRSQCIEVRHCSTFLGCITIVHKKEPLLDSEGNVKEWKNRGFYWYVHNKEIRDSYDTWQVVNSLSKSGFQDNVKLDI